MQPCIVRCLVDNTADPLAPLSRAYLHQFVDVERELDLPDGVFVQVWLAKELELAKLKAVVRERIVSVREAARVRPAAPPARTRHTGTVVTSNLGLHHVSSRDAHQKLNKGIVDRPHRVARRVAQLHARSEKKKENGEKTNNKKK